MEYKEAKTRLKSKIKNNTGKLEIPTLGKRSSFNVQMKNINGEEFIVLSNSKGTTKIIDEKLWDSIINRFKSLVDDTNQLTSYYTAKKWTSKDGNLDTVFSPYVAALVIYLKS